MNVLYFVSSSQLGDVFITEMSPVGVSGRDRVRVGKD